MDLIMFYLNMGKWLFGKSYIKSYSMKHESLFQRLFRLKICCKFLFQNGSIGSCSLLLMPTYFFIIERESILWYFIVNTFATIRNRILFSDFGIAHISSTLTSCLTTCLLEHGADPNGSTNNLCSPLSIMCQRGFYPGVKLLCQFGADTEDIMRILSG